MILHQTQMQQNRCKGGKRLRPDLESKNLKLQVLRRISNERIFQRPGVLHVWEMKKSKPSTFCERFHNSAAQGLWRYRPQRFHCRKNEEILIGKRNGKRYGMRALWSCMYDIEWHENLLKIQKELLELLWLDTGPKQKTWLSQSLVKWNSTQDFRIHLKQRCETLWRRTRPVKQWKKQTIQTWEKQVNLQGPHLHQLPHPSRWPIRGLWTVREHSP